MAKFTFILLFFVLKFHSFGQTLCSLTSTPFTVFYPNTTTVPTQTSVVGSFYLCGPNTVVYDTMGYYSCQYAYVNAGSNLVIKTGCNAVHQVWLKNTATLTILPQMLSPLSITYETGAVINNLSPGVPITQTCSLITFPFANCTIAGLSEKILTKNIFDIAPNPANDKIKITFYDKSADLVDLILYDSHGIKIFEKAKWPTSDNELDISQFSNGSYFIAIKTKADRQYSKLLLYH